MPPTTGRDTRSYDDIVRETVVDPDSSKRPTRDQIRAAHEGHWALDGQERALRARVLEALGRSGADISGVTAEVARELVTLRGQVPGSEMLRVIEDAVAAIPGVSTIHNQVTVREKS
jgi:osmotically-inducible protein OsmY